MSVAMKQNMFERQVHASIEIADKMIDRACMNELNIKKKQKPIDICSFFLVTFYI